MLEGRRRILSQATFLLVEASTAVPFQGPINTVPQILELADKIGFVLYKVVHCSELLPGSK